MGLWSWLKSSLKAWHYNNDNIIEVDLPKEGKYGYEHLFGDGWSDDSVCL